MDDRSIALYVRVSTTRQDLRAQEPELRAWVEAKAGKRKITWYRDKHTGRSMDRPAINRLERDIEARKIGTIVVWRNDRMGRRARQLLEFLERLDELKIDYVSLRDGTRDVLWARRSELVDRSAERVRWDRGRFRLARHGGIAGGAKPGGIS